MNGFTATDVATVLEEANAMTHEDALVFLDAYYADMVDACGAEAIETWWNGVNLYEDAA
jgi:hypothetical protein